jgi:Zn-dependent protease with chaperone function
MKYQPSLPERNDNIAHEHPLKEFALITSALVAIAVLVFWLLGLAVDAVVDRISPETEAMLNKMAAAGVESTSQEALPREAQLQVLIDDLRQCAGLVTPATVRLIESTSPNAAVIPGGTVLVNSGLLEHVKSQNGLSFVLAHELAHLAHRDHLRAMGRGIVLFGISVALTGSTSDISQLLMPVHEVAQSSYSRTRESAADARALQILHCRYGHAGGATELFESLKKNDEDTFAASHYVASHPSMQARIDALQRAIVRGELKAGPVLPLFDH